MFLFRSMTVLSLALLLALAPDAFAAKKKKNKGGVEGTVTAITPISADNKDSGTLTVKLGAITKKKKNAEATPAGEATEKKFVLTKDTTVEIVSGKKKAQEVKSATLADIKTGSSVRITVKTGTADSDVAEKVQIVEGKKKKKAQAQ